MEKAREVNFVRSQKHLKKEVLVCVRPTIKCVMLRLVVSVIGVNLFQLFGKMVLLIL